jgi:protein-L-isoaspartate(D-aspartate) O-methyltransferase
MIYHLSGMARLTPDFELARERMVRNQIEARGLRSKPVLDAMRRVPRHLFTPIQDLDAYADKALPIGFGQTISQPYVVAAMTALLEVSNSCTVLEIGTGSGYQAAVLAELARQVYTIEIIPELCVSAVERLARLRYLNVAIRVGDGSEGWPEKAPFDRILLSAAPPRVPQSLIDQLAVGGRLVAPEGSGEQFAVVIEKSASGQISRRTVFRVRFVEMKITG